jgi:hypothetical protein
MIRQFFELFCAADPNRSEIKCKGPRVAAEKRVEELS